MNHATKARIIIAGLLLSLMLIVAACGTTGQQPTTNANATLGHIPSGTTDITWNAANRTMTVKVSISGLAPKSTHPEHIHKGDCNSDGKILFTLNPIEADAKGVGTSETTFNNVTTGIPQSGWYLNIHNGGTGLTSALQGMAIACGNIINANASTTTDQSVHLILSTTPSSDQAAAGSAQLSLTDNKLTVKVTLSNLVPNSTHIAHIHSGACQAQGAVLYPLSPITADASGSGTSTTTVDQVTSIPGSGWYVNVHLGGTKDELSTQTGDDPIACGNVVTA